MLRTEKPNPLLARETPPSNCARYHCHPLICGRPAGKGDGIQGARHNRARQPRVTISSWDHANTGAPKNGIATRPGGAESRPSRRRGGPARDVQHDQGALRKFLVTEGIEDLDLRERLVRREGGLQQGLDKKNHQWRAESLIATRRFPRKIPPRWALCTDTERSRVSGGPIRRDNGSICSRTGPLPESAHCAVTLATRLRRSPLTMATQLLLQVDVTCAREDRQVSGDLAWPRGRSGRARVRA